MTKFLLCAALVGAVVAAPLNNASVATQFSIPPGMVECYGIGDPHYSSFDNIEPDSMHAGTYLMSGSCGIADDDVPNLTVWVTTDDNGYINSAKIRTDNMGAKMSFVLGEGGFLQCFINGEDYDQAEFDDCAEAAEEYHVALANTGSDHYLILVRDRNNRQVWQLTSYLHFDKYTGIHLFVSKDDYKSHLRGICGDLNGSFRNDWWCWSSSIPYANCWNQDGMKGINSVNWFHGHWPSTCPALHNTDGLSGAETEAAAVAKVDAAAEEAAIHLCSAIVEPEGPFEACFTPEKRQHYAEACRQDELEGAGRGCAVMTELAAHCRLVGGTLVDMSRTECANQE